MKNLGGRPKLYAPKIPIQLRPEMLALLNKIAAERDVSRTDLVREAVDARYGSLIKTS